jgi:hypothetical protein
MAKTSVEQALSRIYAISRELVAPEYTKKEANTRKNTISRGMQGKAKGGAVRKMAKGSTAKKKK